MTKRINQRELKARLNRRQVLLGLGGATTVALPLLRSLRAHADQGAPPKRLVLMYTPNGVIPDAWWPTNATSETSFDLAAIHQPLAPFRDRLLLLGGVDLKVTNSGPGGLHQKGIGGLFTGAELQAGTDFVDGCGQTSGWASGISVDQQVAKTIGQSTLLPSLELGVRALDNDVQGRISYAGAGQPLPPINNPLDAYNRLFSMMGLGGDSLDALRASRRSVLDTVQAQFSTLSMQVSSEDRTKLTQHLELVRDVEKRLTGGNGQNVCSVPGRPATLDPTSENDMPAIADLELDMLAAAFACDLTRVASFQISTSLNRIRYPWLDSTGEGHTLSHAGPSDVGAHDQLVARQTWHAGRLAYLLSRLANIRESDGSTVLDNTLVLWGNEVSLGYTHSHENMPFLMAGGGWHFRTGRYVTYQGASHNDLLVSVLNAMGVPATTFGKADLCKGPLSGLT
ncbi:MAG TPA: DUF1552 domain-containing protein [Polyangiaceae bacterium]|nr:DUF1552 domain-containing protein [Polyangiaceae bacterium]